MQKEDLEYANQYMLTVTRRDQIHAFVAWFDAHFEGMANNVVLSTSPFRRYTHWKQTVFYLDGVIDAEEGEVLRGSIAVRKSKTNFRELDIKISCHFRGTHTENNSVQMYKLR